MGYIFYYAVISLFSKLVVETVKEGNTQLFITIVSTALASSGFWVLIQNVLNRKSARTKMLMGLGHDRIMELALYYLSRGDWITKDEYENLNDYLFQPYINLGGNGSAERIMDEVNRRLKIVDHPPAEYLDRLHKK